MELTLNYKTAKGVERQENISVDLMQSQYSVSPKTRICYTKLSRTMASGELLFDSSEDILYQSATTYDAKAADACKLLLYAINTDKDVHMEVSSEKIYKVQ